MVPKKHQLQRLPAHLQVLFNLSGNLALLKNHELDQFKKDLNDAGTDTLPFLSILFS